MGVALALPYAVVSLCSRESCTEKVLKARFIRGEISSEIVNCVFHILIEGLILASFGGVAERSNALTFQVRGLYGPVGSNPTTSAVDMSSLTRQAVGSIFYVPVQGLTSRQS